MKTLILSLLLLSSNVYADIINFEWDPVKVDTVGKPITVSGYKLYISNKSGTYTAFPAATVPYPNTKWSLERSTAGTYFAVVTAYNSKGESGRSNEVTFTVTVNVPQTTTLKVP